MKNRIRKALSLLLCIAVLASCCTALANTWTGGTTVAGAQDVGVINYMTPMYSSPSTSGGYTALLQMGASVTVVSTSGSYYYVMYNGAYGYVPTAACTISSTGGTSVTSYVTTTTTAVLYTTASTSSSVIMNILSGASLGVISTSGNFYYVYYSGSYGYVLTSACSGSSTSVSYYVNVTTATYLYTGANVSGGYYTALSVGSSIGVISTSGSFYYVYYNGNYGYVPTTACSSGSSNTIAYYVTVNSITPFYKTASTSGGYYGTFAVGDSVGVINTSGSFYYVYVQGYYGYVLTSACTGGSSNTVSYYVTTNSLTSLYSSASTSATATTTIPSGASVGVISTSGSFYYVYYNGSYGYVLTSACTNNGSGTVSYYVTTNSLTSLYSTASTSAIATTTIPSGASVGVISTSGSFYYVYYNGYYGYVLTSVCTSNSNTVSYYVTANGAATIYASASTAGSVVTTAPSGASLGVIRTSGTFYYVYYNGSYGYVLTSACNSNGSGSAAYYVRISYATPLYKQASTASETYGTLSTGASVGVISTSGNFYYVLIDGYYGYVLTSACTTETSTTVGTVVASGTVIAGTTLYSTDSTTSTPIGTISNGGKVGVVSQATSGFYYVKVGTYYGYVLAAACTITSDAVVIPFTGSGPLTTTPITTTGTTTVGGLTTLPTYTGTVTASKTGTIVNCNNWVSMRAEANSSSTRLAKVSKGATVTIKSTSGSYTQVSYGGEEGYILSYYIGN